MIDNKTPNLALPLPHADNLLEDDVARLREALTTLDAHAAQADTDVAEVLTEALTAATEAAKTAQWASIPDKPAKFPPEGHDHAFAELTGQPASFPPAAHGHGWEEVSGKPATFPPAAHNHAYADVTGKPTTFPPATHNHAVSEITSGTLPVALGGTGNTTGNAATATRATTAGNADTATRLQTARTISLTGDVTGSVSFDGAGNVSLPATIAASAKGLMMPTASTFRIAIRRDVTIPPGGTWVWVEGLLTSSGGFLYSDDDRYVNSGVLAGGSRIPDVFNNIRFVLYWRIA